ncbi:hypothetical protein NMY22_g18696 [Coprinellus aureogranulatus]|nr:hypothetical protein NMY22_g18696 [Coprinellus aureogranulatus]
MYSLGVFVELSAANLPDLATLHPSGDHLSTLGLFPGVPYRFPRYSTKDLLAVAMYLYRLFPNLEEIMKLPGAVDTEMNVFWEAVDEAMQSFHRSARGSTPLPSLYAIPTQANLELKADFVLRLMFGSKGLQIQMRGSIRFASTALVNMSPTHEVLDTAELLSLILSSLRDIVHKDRGMEYPIDEPLRSNAQVKWKAVFRDIAFVNRAFFLASADILWEHMHSLDPFLALLKPFNSGAEPSVSVDSIMAHVVIEQYVIWKAYSAGIRKAAWQRFEMYSTTTKSLALGAPEASPISCWAFYLSASHGRPSTLFPSLKNLYLNSTDNISMMIALPTVSRVETLHIDLGFEGMENAEAQEAIAALITAVADGSQSISILRIQQPVNAQCIRNLSRLRDLSLLHVVLRLDDIHALELSLRSHNRLIIEEAYGTVPNDEYIQNRDAQLQLFPTSGKEGKYVLAFGSCSMHDSLSKVYSAMPPRSYQLHAAMFNVDYDINRDEDILSPTAIANYLSDNLGLFLFQVKGPLVRRPAPLPQVVERARTNPRLDDLQPLLTRLASSNSLVILIITSIIYKPSDTIAQMLSVLKHLHRLAKFQFHPFTLDGGTDGFLLPPLTVLADIAQSNPAMASFSTYFDLSIVSLDLQLPVDHSCGYFMRSLVLFPGSSIQFPKHSTRQTLDLAFYLYRLFPNISNMVEMIGAPDSLMGAFWEPVDQAIETFRKVQQLPKLPRSRFLPYSIPPYGEIGVLQSLHDLTLAPHGPPSQPKYPELKRSTAAAGYIYSDVFRWQCLDPSSSPTLAFVPPTPTHHFLHKHNTKKVILIRSKLPRKAKHLHATIKAHKTVLLTAHMESSIPTEILQRIFIFVAFRQAPEHLDGVGVAQHDKTSLFAVCGVSRRWRQAAMSCCALWTHFPPLNISNAPKSKSTVPTREDDKRILGLYVTCSGSLPLTVTVRVGEGEGWDEEEAVSFTEESLEWFGALASVCERWDSLDLTISAPAAEVLLPQIKGRLTSLASLKLTSGQRISRGSALERLMRAPSLQHVDLDLGRCPFVDDPLTVDLPWNQLKSVKFRGPPLTRYYKNVTRDPVGCIGDTLVPHPLQLNRDTPIPTRSPRPPPPHLTRTAFKQLFLRGRERLRSDTPPSGFHRPPRSPNPTLPNIPIHPRYILEIPMLLDDDEAFLGRAATEGRALKDPTYVRLVPRLKVLTFRYNHERLASVDLLELMNMVTSRTQLDLLDYPPSDSIENYERLTHVYLYDVNVSVLQLGLTAWETAKLSGQSTEGWPPIPDSCLAPTEDTFPFAEEAAEGLQVYLDAIQGMGQVDVDTVDECKEAEQVLGRMEEFDMEAANSLIFLTSSAPYTTELVNYTPNGSPSSSATPDSVLTSGNRVALDTIIIIARKKEKNIVTLIVGGVGA